MMNILDFLGPAESEGELRLHLGEMLGIGKPAPAAVLRRALVDESFALYLVRASGERNLLDLLLSDPRNDAFANEPGILPARSDIDAPAAKTPGDLALIWKAGKAVMKWGAAGFARVPPERFEARFHACEACEYLAAPPDRLIYNVRLSRSSDPRVCTACGCTASRKAALPTESCPVADPDNPRLNRWGESRFTAAAEARSS